MSTTVGGGGFRLEPWPFFQVAIEESVLKKKCIYVGSIALVSHNTLKWSEILGLSFLCSAGGPGNPSYRVEAHLVNFALHFQKCNFFFDTESITDKQPCS